MSNKLIKEFEIVRVNIDISGKKLFGLWCVFLDKGKIIGILV